MYVCIYMYVSTCMYTHMYVCGGGAMAEERSRWGAVEKLAILGTDEQEFVGEEARGHIPCHAVRT